MICFSMFDIVNLFLKKTMGRGGGGGGEGGGGGGWGARGGGGGGEETQEASFYFRGLKCSGCWRVFDGGLGEKVLFRAS